MSEDNAAPVNESGQSAQSMSPFNADGTLVENWHTLAPEGYEDLREDKTLPRIKKFWDIAKSYVHVRKQVPLDKMARPNENFTDSDWNEFYEAGGRPKTAGDYNIKRPRDFPEELWDDDKARTYQDFFHKIGLNKKQADALVNLNNEQVLALKQSMEQQAELELTALKNALRKKWGAAYDQNVHLGDIAVEKGSKGDLNYKERLLAKVNADPDLIEFASSLGSLFAEHGIVEDTNIPTPGDMDERISKAMQQPAYLNRDHPDHKRQVQLVQQLFQEKEKYKKTG